MPNKHKTKKQRAAEAAVAHCDWRRCTCRRAIWAAAKGSCLVELQLLPIEHPPPLIEHPL